MTFNDLSIGMLSYKRHKTLEQTLSSYKRNGLLDLCKNFTIFFQDISKKDILIANHFGIRYTGWNSNMVPFDYRIKEIYDTINTPYTLFLENDWLLIENKEITENLILEAINLIKSNKVDVVKLRHRKNPGTPLYSENLIKNKEKNPEVWNKWKVMLMECVHWYNNPEKMFPEYIKKDGNYYYTSSEYVPYTNNPCIYNTNLFKNKISPFFKENLNIEVRIQQGYWQNLNLKVCHGDGLFKHCDNIYGDI